MDIEIINTIEPSDVTVTEQDLARLRRALQSAGR